jgi:hypothetical protein
MVITCDQCGAQYSAQDYRELEFRQLFRMPPRSLEIRACPCGSIVGARVDELGTPVEVAHGL